MCGSAVISTSNDNATGERLYLSLSECRFCCSQGVNIVHIKITLL